MIDWSRLLWFSLRRWQRGITSNRTFWTLYTYCSLNFRKSEFDIALYNSYFLISARIGVYRVFSIDRFFWDLLPLSLVMGSGNDQVDTLCEAQNPYRQYRRVFR